jgi:hypothetical protein
MREIQTEKTMNHDISKNVFDGDVSPEEIATWLEQFTPDDRPIAQKLVAAFDYTSTSKLKKIVVDLYAAITSKLPAGEPVWYVPVGYVAKSGAVIAYFFRTMNNLSLSHFIAPSDIQSLRPDTEGMVVFLDDYLGSGHQAVQVWENVARPAAAKSKLKFAYAVLVAHRNGLQHVERQTGFQSIATRALTEENLPFGKTSKVFPDEKERNFAREVAKKYGERVYPNHALGYRDTQGLLGFFYSTPNNTLPIFWSTENGWRPLLTHGESYRDPAFLMGPPPGLQRTASKSSSEALLHMSSLEDIDVPDGLINKILEEFKKLQMLNLMAQVLSELKVNMPAAELLLRVVQALKVHDHERQPVSSAIAMVPDGLSLEDIGEPIARSLDGPALKDTKTLVTLASWIAGQKARSR